MTIGGKEVWYGNFPATPSIREFPIGTKLEVYGPPEWRESVIGGKSVMIPQKQPSEIMQVVKDDTITLTRRDRTGHEATRELHGEEITGANLSYAPVPGNVNFVGVVFYAPGQTRFQ